MSETGIVIPEIELVEAELETRKVLGGDAVEETTAPGRVSVGRAEPIPLIPDHAANDVALLDQLRADPGHAYWVLAFTCSFWPGDGPVVETRLGVQVRPDAPGVELPLVTLLEPERRTHPTERTRTMSFNPTVAIGPVEVGGGGAGQEEKVTMDNAYRVATGKGESVAQWFFQRQPGVELEGMHDLRMVIRTAAGTPAVAEMKIATKIRRKAAGIVPYGAKLPEKLRLIPIPAAAAG
jgi:hypothetical protein